MQLKKTIGKFALTAALALATVPTFGQDLLARQAPVDRRATKVDTMALHLMERSEASQAVADLYNDWNNRWAHAQGNLPETFKIDLRGFTMPTTSRLITSNYGPRWGRVHKGLDIKVYIGDTIYAAFEGTVRVVRYEANGYGNFVVIRHPNGLETVYGHMSKQLVKPNQRVKSGEPIGLGGNTGRSTGSHLHFETRLCGVALNPALMFDFKNQDVTGDFYTYRRGTYNRDSERATRSYGKSTSRTQASVAATTPKESAKSSRQTRATRQQATAKTSKKEQRGRQRASASHTVSKGETLYSIARKNGTTVEKLCKLNHIGKNMRVRVGQKIKTS
ncbi:MAG: peptidoglycan DD-metalloendopeptidase family protein [Prevotella sp.]|nr:peptidoglycan DD-metalloendopeptidase family protein [Prevotella sp.]